MVGGRCDFGGVGVSGDEGCLRGVGVCCGARVARVFGCAFSEMQFGDPQLYRFVHLRKGSLHARSAVLKFQLADLSSRKCGR